MGALVATGVALLPLGYLAIRIGGSGWDAVRSVLARSVTVELALRSLTLAGIVTVVSVVIGVGLAWLVACTDVPGRRVWHVLLAMPLALPSYVAAWSWIGWRPELAGRSGASIVLISICYPYVFLPTAAAFRRVDPSLYDVAHTLGSRRVAVFVRVTLPQIWLSVAGGALLVALYVLSDFGAVATMRHPVLTHAIYQSYRSSFDRTPAAVLGGMLALMGIVIVVLDARVRRRMGDGVGSHALERPVRVMSLGRLRPVAMLAPVFTLGIALGIPAWGLRSWMRQGTTALAGDRFVEAMSNTLWVAVLGAVVVVVLALPVAVLSVRYGGRLARTAETAAYAGHALPGVVVGLSLVFFGVRYTPAIYQRLPLLVFGYAVLFLSLAMGALRGALSRVPRELELVSRTLGHGPLRTWSLVTARLAAPGIGAALTLVCLSIMKELPTTLFLRPTGFDTLATELWSKTTSFQRASAAPYAIAIVFLAALPAAVLPWLLERNRERTS